MPRSATLLLVALTLAVFGASMAVAAELAKQPEAPAEAHWAGGYALARTATQSRSCSIA